MNSAKQFIAADLGASSGRVMAGGWDGVRFSLREIHRFANGGIQTPEGLRWDLPRIWSHLRDALLKYATEFNGAPGGIGVDAWGVDFGLLDVEGRVLGNPFHYRDKRTHGMAKRFFQRMPECKLFEATGTQAMEINTLFQLCSLMQDGDTTLRQAHTLLMIPDLLLYLLGGEKCAEYSEVSTMQMYSLREKQWASDVLEAASIPHSLLPKVVAPGTVVSNLLPTVLGEDGFYRPVPVIAVASHDTASAVAAVPNMDVNSVFLSSGTWSLMGVEITEPITTPEALKLQFTNEGSADHGVLLLKNITGLWLLQECVRQWQLEGQDLTWDSVVRAASGARALQSFFDPNNPIMQAGEDIPAVIRGYCAETGQSVPQTVGEIARCIFESLSLKYRSVLASLIELTRRDLSMIRVIGGGVMNASLCQMTADACNCTVVAGPVEASALGNVMVQAIATGYLRDMGEGRAAIAMSFLCDVYEPRRSDAWDEAHARFKQLEVD